MPKKSLIILSILFAFADAAFAQKIHTPEKGSPERKAILDALRIPVESELKQKIIFKIEKFNVLGSWAFLSGMPQRPDGGSPDYKKTPYQEAIEEGAFDGGIFALLKNDGEKWKVVTYAIGCTDICYSNWWSEHQAPKALFPYNE